MKKCKYCGRENDDTAIHCFECGTELPSESSSIAQSNQTPDGTGKPEIACPHCGEFEALERVVFPHRKFRWPVFLLGGIEAVWLLNFGQIKRFHCRKCGTSFNIRTTGAKIMLVLFSALLLWVWLPILVWLVYMLFRAFIFKTA
jgi:DNA-directed RNA polymerase subunit RPC12/RpoP